MSQHIKYRPKQNPYLWGVLALCLLMTPMSITRAYAKEPAISLTPSFELSFITPVLDKALSALRDRKRDIVFNLLTKDRQKEYGGTAGGFMTFLRLHEHAIYDHTSYKMISSTPLSDKEIVYKIQLLSRSGHENIAIIKLLQEGGVHWHIQSMTVLVGNDEREI